MKFSAIVVTIFAAASTYGAAVPAAERDVEAIQALDLETRQSSIVIGRVQANGATLQELRIAKSPDSIAFGFRATGIELKRGSCSLCSRRAPNDPRTGGIACDLNSKFADVFAGQGLRTFNRDIECAFCSA